MIILGIDPGSARMGFGVVTKAKGEKMKMIDYGCIETAPGHSDGERLKTLNNELNKIIKKYKPNALAVESLFFFKNPKTVMTVSQAKGVILMTAARKKIPTREYTPLQVKFAITGYGRADKKDVQKKIETLLSIKEKIKSDDAADALAIASTYFLYKKPRTKLS